MRLAPGARDVAFTVIRTTRLAPVVAWATMTDLAEHTRHVPLTSVQMPPSGLRLGAEVAAVTRCGPLAVADTMLVTVLDPGRRLRLVKTGRPVRGWAEITVEPADGEGSRVTWREELWLPGLRWATRPLGDRLGAVLFGRVVDGLLRAAGQTGS
ncbi:MAG: SRPBCC family protein [Dermatophilaceae bacterium]